MKNIQKIELTNKNKEFGSFKYNQEILSNVAGFVEGFKITHRRAESRCLVNF